MKKSSTIFHPSVFSDSVPRKIKKKIVDMLKLKEKEKLTFVYQTVYNIDPVQFFDIAGKDGSVSAACKIFFTLFLRVSVTDRITDTRSELQVAPNWLMNMV